MCYQFRIRRPDTQRHRAIDHSTHHRTLPIPVGDPFGTVLLSPGPFAIFWPVTEFQSPEIFDIMDTKHIGVTTLTIQGHVT